MTVTTKATNFREAMNPLFAIDVYKADHISQYKLSGKVTKVYSNFTNRGSRIEGVRHVVNFGLQAFLKDYLMDSFKPFFESDVEDVCDTFEKRMETILGPNNIGSDHIRALHTLGYIPLRFSSVPEGTLVPIGVPSFTVENTLPEFFWLTNYIETALSASIWQASTSATKSWDLRRLFDKKAKETGSNLDMVGWQGHDFSFRGMPGIEAAAASGAAHLLSFNGSDSLVAMDWIEYFYPGSPEGEIILGSVPATEHSVMCTGIAKMGELEVFRRLLKLYKSGIFSAVSDSFDFWRVLTEFLPELKDEILERDGKLVIRPDSGDPVDIICGTSQNTEAWADHEIYKAKDDKAKVYILDNSPEEKGAIEVLWDIFGGTRNAEGFKELDPHIGLIYGDSITKERATEIADRLKAKGFAFGNVVFGIGSYFFQGNTTRDTFMSAVKATFAEVDGEGVNILKDPATDNGTKKSATGRLAVKYKADGTLYLVQKATTEDEAASVLQPVWENGKFLKEYSFAEVRANLRRTTEILERNGGIS